MLYSERRSFTMSRSMVFPKAGQETYLIISQDNHGQYVAKECRGFRKACDEFRKHKEFVGNNVALAQVLVSYGQEI